MQTPGQVQCKRAISTDAIRWSSGLQFRNYQDLLKETLGHGAESYEVGFAPVLMGLENSGVAYSLKDHCVFVLASDEARHDREYLPIWLLDTAKQLTEILQTFVVPDQRADFTYWDDSQGGRFIAYKFKMADAPTTIVPVGTGSR